MLKVNPVNYRAFRDLMDAHHRLYETHEANGEIPKAWQLDDPMVRRDAILVQSGNVFGVIFDGNFPHTRKTIKARHNTENFEWANKNT